MTQFAYGHEWGWGLKSCARCGVSLNDYENGEPYQCGSARKPAATVARKEEWTDPPPTREEAERAWSDAHPVHTTEPPEWKEPFDPNATMYPSDFFTPPSAQTDVPLINTDRTAAPLDLRLPCKYCRTMVSAVQMCQCVSIRKAQKARQKPEVTPGTVTNTGIILTGVETAPLDRALEAFIARRKAKREVCDEAVSDALTRELANATVQDWVDDVRTDTLSHAMSLPVSFTARMGGRY